MDEKKKSIKLDVSDDSKLEVKQKGPVNFIIGSITSFFLFSLFFLLSKNVALYFANHRPSNSSELVQSISTSLNTLIVGLFFLATF